jgi:L-ascorbate metabolism protein UlaG (beta-lactamase superfamily)
VSFVEITWLGHSCFRLRSRELTIITDPFGADGWGYSAVETAANVVTVSHEDPHHAYVEGVSGKPRIVRGPGEYEIGGVMITGVRTTRRAGEGEPLGKNTLYVFRLEELSVCHLGDLASALTPEQLEYAQDCGVLLVPVGGGCTINGVEAARVVAQIEPRLVLPMHYATPETEGHLALEGLERFKKEMGAGEATPQARLTVTANSLPAEPTVVILEPRR